MIGLRGESRSRISRYLPDIVYVLSGGAAKGFCHLGMMEALENRGFRPDMVVGTSAGSIMAALYAHFGSVAAVTGWVEKLLASEEFASFEGKYLGETKAPSDAEESRLRHYFESFSETIRSKVHLGRALVTSAMVAEKDAVGLFSRLFEGISFDTLKIPFAAVAVDLSEGIPVVFTKEGSGVVASPSRTIAGPKGLMKAVMASCAIPLVFPAVDIGGHPFVDGGIMANLPSREARALCPGRNIFMAGFDVSAPVKQAETEFSSVGLALRLLGLATASKQSADRELVDILFQPIAAEYPWSAFTDFRKFMDMGRAYMTEERLAAFQAKYRARCLEKATAELNPIRRMLASARIKRALPELGPV